MKWIAQILPLDSTGHNYSEEAQKKSQVLPYLPFPQCPLNLHFWLNLNRDIRVVSLQQEKNHHCHYSLN